MTMDIRGACRIPRGGATEDDVVVRDSGDNEWLVRESLYRARGYQPPFEELQMRATSPP